MGSMGATSEGPWQPPTVVEAGLYTAGMNGDWPAFFDVLAGTDLFFPMSREVVDAVPGGFRFAPFRDPQVEGLCVAVFTRGMLPPPSGGQVFERGNLGPLAKAWPRTVNWLAVNPGTPVETFVPAEPRQWKRHAKRAKPEARLKTLWTGPRSDAMAHGMACGALLLVNNGTLWNQLGWQSGGYSETRELLKTWWGITGREGWLEAQEGLLRGELSPPAWEFCLRVRHVLIEEYGTAPGAVQWRETAERVLLARTAEVVDKTGRPPQFDLDADITLAQDLIGRILRYEARFRADGILAADASVRSVLAWDYGRASFMARDGLGARYCDTHEAETALLRAGAAARRMYRSWPDFAAGYILGRCLHFDDETFGDWYREMLEVHRILSTEPESPWLTVPWEIKEG